MITSALRRAIALVGMLPSAFLMAAQLDIPGPSGSGLFGSTLTLLPNGNFVVTDPDFDAPAGAADVGAVYLFRPSGELIYTLTGSSTGDRVGGSYGISVLSNGNFVVLSPDWDNASVFDAGAATWCSGVGGSNQVVSASNSLVGATASNRVGSAAYALSNGHYVVSSFEWDSSGVIDAGAVTWGDGFIGSSGVVGAGNSLIGSSADDRIGIGGVTVLSNGNYLVSSQAWDNGSILDAGAVTWRSGIAQFAGVVSASNSLVGSTTHDLVGSTRVTALSNGHYVVGSSEWDNGSIVNAGAATWGNGVIGSSGVLNAANSLVGTSPEDQVSSGNGEGLSIVALSNGHYVVRSISWDHGIVADVGAVTWGNGIGGSVGPVNAGNSLIGTTAGDRVGGSTVGGGVTPLNNGHYVVASPTWDNGVIVDAGAVTWRNGISASSGVVSASNSLVGSSVNDYVGEVVYALSNGHFVAQSSSWDNGGIINAGAVTWRDGNGGAGAVVSGANSLVGSSMSDQIGSRGVAALSDGNYVVASRSWSNGPGAPQAGAVTWRSGTSSSGGPVSTTNSLVGTAASNQVGYYGVTALNNGGYVVASSYWDNGATMNVGAVTRRSAGSSSGGTINTSNSLVGTTANDLIGYDSYIFPGITAQANGNYVFRSPYWDNGGALEAGAVTVGFADGTSTGALLAANSVRGTSTAPNAGFRMKYVYDALRAQLIVARPDSNIVSILRPGAVTSASIVLDTPDPSDPGAVVTFVTTLVASPSPSSGSVRIEADSGETCTDFTPTITGANTAQFSCQILFTSLGERSMRAEFLGTNTHGYSASGLEPHTVASGFADGFE